VCVCLIETGCLLVPRHLVIARTARVVLVVGHASVAKGRFRPPSRAIAGPLSLAQLPLESMERPFKCQR